MTRHLATHDIDDKATRWLSWYGVGLASADRLPVVVRIPAGPLGSLKCDPPKASRNGFLCRISRSRKSSCVPTSHICILQDCTRRVLGRLWRRPALNRKSYLCQVCTSLMDGEAPVRDIAPATPSAGTEPIRSPERHPCDSRQNQAEDGPNTRQAVASLASRE